MSKVASRLEMQTFQPVSLILVCQSVVLDYVLFDLLNAEHCDATQREM
jgi:hypothetical protein